MPTEAEVRAQLEKIVNSKLFVQKRELRRVLRHLVEATLNGSGSTLTQKTIAQDLLNKASDFTGDKDSSVRGHMLRLRAGLAKYYADEGATDLVLIKLDHGPGYAPSIDYRLPAVATSAGTEIQTSALVTSEQAHLRYTINVRADPKDIEMVLGNAHHLLHSMPPGSIINFDFARISSVLLYVSCSPAGYQWLTALWRQGGLAALLGFPVVSVRASEAIDAELREKGNAAVERCISPIVDVLPPKVDRIMRIPGHVNNDSGGM